MFASKHFHASFILKAIIDLKLKKNGQVCDTRQKLTQKFALVQHQATHSVIRCFNVLLVQKNETWFISVTEICCSNKTQFTERHNKNHGNENFYKWLN